MIAFNHANLISLVQNRVLLSELEIGSIQLGKHYHCIDLFEINDIYVIDPEIEGYNFENSNKTIRERLTQLETLKGHIHLAGGLVCTVENQRITEFRFTKKYMEPVAHFTREDILKFHGEPDYELVDDELYGGFNYAIDSYILVYPGKKLNFHVHPDTGKLVEITTHSLDASTLRRR
ncbi:hypothetical protein D3C87_83440 [compost metagenome]